jgi:tetratricopeptide (TPR) repeat protein
MKNLNLSKHLFIFFISLFAYNYCLSQKEFVYKLSIKDSTTLDFILKSCFKDSLKNENKMIFWDIVNKHGGDFKDIKDFWNMKSIEYFKVNEYMRLFYNDALVSIESKKPFKSIQRTETESKFNLTYRELFNKNDSLMIEIAKENQVFYEGRDVLFTKELVLKVIENLDHMFELLEYNINSLYIPPPTEERDFLEKYKKSFENSNFEISIKWIDSALFLNPKNGSYYFLRGKSNLKLNQLKLALDDLNKSIFYDSLNYQAYNSRAITHSKLNFSNLAMKDYTSSIKINPYHNIAYNNLGDIFLQSNDYISAIEYYSKALKNIYNGVTYYNLGLAVYHHNKDFKQVIEYLDSAITIDQGIIDAYYTRGLCYSQLKKYEKALLDFNTTLKMSENHEKALVNRGIVYVNLNKLDNACKDFKKAKSLGFSTAQQYIDKICN